MAMMIEVLSYDWESEKAVGVDVKVSGKRKPTRCFFPKSMIQYVGENAYVPEWMLNKKLEDSTPQNLADSFGDTREFSEPVAMVVDAAEILAFFTRAAEKVKFPKVTTASLKFQRAGERAKIPGSINVTDLGHYPDNKWYGRIDLDGKFSPTRIATPEVIAAVEAFNADPVAFATSEGKSSGRCVFCRTPVGEGDDRRSIELGYGPVCASKYGLPWS